MVDVYLIFNFPMVLSLIGPTGTSLASVDFSCSLLNVVRMLEPAGDDVGSNLLLLPEAPDLYFIKSKNKSLIILTTEILKQHNPEEMIETIVLLKSQILIWQDKI